MKKGMTKLKIYLDSSWQNKEYEQVLNTLRLEGMKLMTLNILKIRN
jgi:hypothetical protein